MQAAVLATVCTTLFFASFLAFPHSPPLPFGFSAVESDTEATAADISAGWEPELTAAVFSTVAFLAAGFL